MTAYRLSLTDERGHEVFTVVGTVTHILGALERLRLVLRRLEAKG